METRSNKAFFLGAMLLLALTLLQTSEGQSICNIPLSSLMACRPAVTPPNPAAPTATCCSVLTKANLSCLCSYKNSKLLPQLGIDPNLAVQLPAKCKLPNAPTC
ncbi:hypothetical protein SLA2020_208630 [Shorea laevis]